jgi:hypothetical protein
MPAPPHLPREVLLWLQGLDLSTSLRDPSRELADGVLAAEVVARHFPALVHLHAFSPAAALDARRANWGLLARLMARGGLELGLSPAGVEAVVRGAPGAGAGVLTLLYRVLAPNGGDGDGGRREEGGGDGGCAGAGWTAPADAVQTPSYAQPTASTLAAATAGLPHVQVITDTRARAAAVGDALARWEEERVVSRLRQPGGGWVRLGRRRRLTARMRDALRLGAPAAGTCPAEAGLEGCVRVGQLADGSGVARG